MMFPKVTAVILTWDRPELAISCIQAVQRTNYPNLEILVVENGSTRDSVEQLRVALQGYEVLWLPKNLGYVQGNNLGVAKAVSDPRTDYLLILSNDTAVSEKAIETGIQFLEEEQSVVLVQPKLLFMNENIIDCTGHMVNPLLNHVERGKGAIDNGQYDMLAGGIFAPKAAAFFVRAEFVRNYGFFDPQFGYFYEDIDLSWRAWLTGHQVAYCADSVIHHHRHSPTLSSREADSSQAFHLIKNRLRTMLKNYERSSLCLWLAPVLMAGLRRYMVFRIQGQRELASAVLRAHVWNIEHWNETMMLRARVQQWRVVSDVRIVHDRMAPLVSGYLRARSQWVASRSTHAHQPL